MAEAKTPKQTTTWQDFWWKYKRNRSWQAATFLFVLIVVAAILGLVLFLRKDTDDAPYTPTATTETTGQITRTIDGKMVKADAGNLPIKAVVIENLATVRPQSGLDSAQVVYETLAEGGITRFMALFATDESIDPIGPVRSARHYFVDWAEEYGGMFFHVGGSPLALGILDTSNFMTDVNQFSNGGYYYRDESIPAPHNVFTTTNLLSLAERDQLPAGEPEYRPYTFSDEVASTNTKPATTITIDFSSFAYQAEWKYDPSTSRYIRYNGGELHTDALTQEAITAEDVIVQYVDSELLEEDSGRIDITTIGTGKAIVFRNGVAIEGTWKKLNRGDRTMFFDEDDNEISFAPGKQWISVVPNGRTVQYQ